MRIPYHRNRRYLTGMDWIIGTLDCMTHRATGAGNCSQIVLQLEGSLDPQLLQETVIRFASFFPALSGWPARDWMNLAPYWKMKREKGSCAVKVLPAQPSDGAAITSLCQALNTPFATREEHLAFHLVHVGSERSFLGMVFDHRLFDARGAELFLNLLAEFAADMVGPSRRDGRGCAAESAPQDDQREWQHRHLRHPTREPSLSNWADKFRAGRNVNRALRQCASLSDSQCDSSSASSSCGLFDLPGNKAGVEHGFEQLDADENQRLTQAAYQLGGYLVKMPYLLALAVQAVDQIFAARNLAPEHYVIPVSIDRRPGSHESQTLFFNHFSFAHFLISRADLQSRPDLVKAIARQMYEQVKTGLPQDFQETMMLMRILPVGLLAGLSGKVFGGNFGTFAFSWLGESACSARSFLGLRITNILHTPRVSVPPGVGVFLNEFDGKMNVTTAYLRGVLSPEEAGLIGRHFHP